MTRHKVASKPKGRCTYTGSAVLGRNNNRNLETVVSPIEPQHAGCLLIALDNREQAVFVF